MRYVIVGICLTLLTSCGFHGKMTKTETGFEWKANRPCIIKKGKDGSIEVDGKSQPLILELPDVSAFGG